MLKITKQSITLTKGDDASIQLIPRYKDKTAYVFLEGDRGVFRLKTGNTLIEKECDIYQDPNKMVVSFQPADTINLKPGIYRYEVELITIYGFHYTFIADQTFIIGNEYEQRLQASGSNGSGNAGSNLPEVDGELTEDPVVSGEIQPTNPSVDYNNLTNKPKLNGVQIAGNHDNAYYGIPTELADLTADADHRTVSDTEKETWNAKSDFSGSYNDLTDVPEDLVEDAEYVHTDNNYTSAEKTKLGDIESGAEVNVQADWNETDTSSDAYIRNKPTIPAAQVNSDWNASSGVAEILHKPTLGTAAAKDYTGSVMENSTDLVESGAVKTAIDNAISSVYKPAGNKACAELVSTLLVAANLGNVYNMTDDGVTTADFVEGAGKPIEAGDNVVIVDIGSSVYKFDLLSGMVDLSNYVQKSSTSGLIKNDGTIDPTAYAKQNEMSVSTSGDQTTIQLKNGTTATVINAHQDISGKANKSEMTVTPGTGSDADKTTIQLKSGTDATVLTQHQDISGKVDKEQGKGLSTNDYTTVDKEKLAAISTEANKVTASETNGNIQIDGTETTVYDDTAVQNAIENIEDELSTDYATVEGNPINFSTLSAQKSKSTILSLEPIQDLHGYDKPWVGGAGKNLLPMTLAGFKSANTSGTWSNDVYTLNSLTITPLLDTDNNLLGFKINGTASAESVINMPRFTSDGSSYTFNGLYPISRTYIQWAVHDVATINSDETTLTISAGNRLLKLTVLNGANISNSIFNPMIRLSSVTDATFAPYTNYASISGRTEIGILGCGENLANVEFEQGAISYQENKTYSYAKVSSSTRIRCKSLITLNPNINYTLKLGNQNYRYVIQTFNSEQLMYSSTYSNQWKDTDVTFSGAPYIAIAVKKSDESNILVSEYADAKIKLLKQDSISDLTIDLGQTVYGGQLDVENGECVINLIKKIFDGTEAWAETSETPSRFMLAKPTEFAGQSEQIANENVISNIAVKQYTNSIGGYFSISNASLFFNKISENETLSDFQTMLENTNAEVVGVLATPITIQLTPNAVNLLKGANYITTDGDNITLTYRDGKVATLGDLTSAVDNLDSKIDESKILTDTVTGDKYILVVTNGVLDIQQVSN